MMAAASANLPRAIRGELRKFFDSNEEWLSRVLSAGCKARTLRLRSTPHLEARFITMTFEGAMLIARSYGEPKRFEEVVERVLSDLAPH